MTAIRYNELVGDKDNLEREKGYLSEAKRNIELLANENSETKKDDGWFSAGNIGRVIRFSALVAEIATMIVGMGMGMKARKPKRGNDQHQAPHAAGAAADNGNGYAAAKRRKKASENQRNATPTPPPVDKGRVERQGGFFPYPSFSGSQVIKIVPEQKSINMVEAEADDIAQNLRTRNANRDLRFLDRRPLAEFERVQEAWNAIFAAIPINEFINILRRIQCPALRTVLLQRWEAVVEFEFTYQRPRYTLDQITDILDDNNNINVVRENGGTITADERDIMIRDRENQLNIAYNAEFEALPPAEQALIENREEHRDVFFEAFDYPEPPLPLLPRLIPALFLRFVPERWRNQWNQQRVDHDLWQFRFNFAMRVMDAAADGLAALPAEIYLMDMIDLMRQRLDEYEALRTFREGLREFENNQFFVILADELAAEDAV
jgi:hypothetical protein